MLYRLVIAGRTSGSRRGRGRLRKHGLPSRTRTASTTLVNGSFVLPGPQTQEFVMIPNLGYHNSEYSDGQSASTPSPS